MLQLTGNGGMPYYFGFAMFFLSGIILIPFSKPVKLKPTEILIAVSQNKFKIYIYKTSPEDNITYEREIELYDYSYV